MPDDTPLSDRIAPLTELMRKKLGVRARSFPAALSRAGRRLPRHLRREAQALAAALPLADHPKLRQTLDMPQLDAAARDLQAFLQSIDLADRRKGFILGVLGTIAFNLLALAALAVLILAWRGYF